MPEEEKHWSKLLDHIAFMREQNDPEEIISSFKVNYRKKVGEFNGEFKLKQNQLLKMVTHLTFSMKHLSEISKGRQYR